MTSRQARRERRAAERKARKAEIKRLKAAAPEEQSAFSSELNADRLQPHPLENGFVSQNKAATAESLTGFVSQNITVPADADTGFVSQIAPVLSTRAEINRKNAQRSSGPRTQAGKMASSRNSLKHGLASGELIIEGEDRDAFEQLLAAFLEEHQPANITEEMLVRQVAQSCWLEQRAIRLQNECFTSTGVDEKRLALFIRYQTAYNRAFYKALDALRRMKKEHSGFVSQKSARAVSEPDFVSQNKRMDPPAFTQNAEEREEIGFVSQNACRHGGADGLAVRDDSFVSQTEAPDGSDQTATAALQRAAA